MTDLMYIPVRAQACLILFAFVIARAYRDLVSCLDRVRIKPSVYLLIVFLFRRCFALYRRAACNALCASFVLQLLFYSSCPVFFVCLAPWKEENLKRGPVVTGALGELQSCRKGFSRSSGVLATAPNADPPRPYVTSGHIRQAMACRRRRSRRQGESDGGEAGACAQNTGKKGRPPNMVTLLPVLNSYFLHGLTIFHRIGAAPLLGTVANSGGRAQT